MSIIQSTHQYHQVHRGASDPHTRDLIPSYDTPQNVAHQRVFSPVHLLSLTDSCFLFTTQDPTSPTQPCARYNRFRLCAQLSVHGLEKPVGLLMVPARRGQPVRIGFAQQCPHPCPCWLFFPCSWSDASVSSSELSHPQRCHPVHNSIITGARLLGCRQPLYFYVISTNEKRKRYQIKLQAQTDKEKGTHHSQTSYPLLPSSVTVSSQNVPLPSTAVSFHDSVLVGCCTKYNGAFL